MGPYHQGRLQEAYFPRNAIVNSSFIVTDLRSNHTLVENSNQIGNASTSEFRNTSAYTKEECKMTFSTLRTQIPFTASLHRSFILPRKRPIRTHQKGEKVLQKQLKASSVLSSSFSLPSNLKSASLQKLHFSASCNEGFIPFVVDQSTNFTFHCIILCTVLR